MKNQHKNTNEPNDKQKIAIEFCAEMTGMNSCLHNNVQNTYIWTG